MKKSKKILITVSALALRSAVLSPSAAHAQVGVTCPIPVNMGVHAACGSSGRYRLNPNGADKLQSGCLAIATPAQVGQCRIFYTGAPTGKNVQVDFPDNRVTAVNGGDTVEYRRWRINTSGVGGNHNKMTFTPAEISATVTVNVAARMHFNATQAFGSYVTTNVITVTPQ